MIFKTTLRQREIEDRAAKQTAALRRRRARRPAQRGDEHADCWHVARHRLARRAGCRRGIGRRGVTDIPPHLTSSAAAFLSTPNDGPDTGDPVRAVEYECPRAAQAIQVLNRLLDHPRTTRMPGVAFYGDSGMGKTMIMEGKFRRDHPPHPSIAKAASNKHVCSRCRWLVNPGSAASTRRL